MRKLHERIVSWFSFMVMGLNSCFFGEYSLYLLVRPTGRTEQSYIQFMDILYTYNVRFSPYKKKIFPKKARLLLVTKLYSTFRLPSSVFILYTSSFGMVSLIINIYNVYWTHILYEYEKGYGISRCIWTAATAAMAAVSARKTVEPSDTNRMLG